MKKLLNDQQLVNELRKLVKKYGQKAVSSQIRISQGHISDLLAGNKFFSKKVANKFGYKQVTYYEVMK